VKIFLDTADLAAAMNVRVYTVGASSYGQTAPFPVQNPYFGRRMMQIPIDIDETMMETVARRTGGQYYRATDSETLRAIYEEISELEKTELQERVYTDREERYAVFLWPAFFLVILELLLSVTRLRRLP
jgi:Ca-activated chloride channel homolog